jgi:hypothetical protein
MEQNHFMVDWWRLGEGKGYITLNNKRMKELGLSIGDWVEVVLNPDESKYGMPVPEELAELLRQDPEGERRFEMLTPGKQRYIIHYIKSGKKLAIENRPCNVVNWKFEEITRRK